MNEIWQALENNASSNARGINARRVANKQEIILLKKFLLQFLDDLDGGLTVSEVREALEEYKYE